MKDNYKKSITDGVSDGISKAVGLIMAMTFLICLYLLSPEYLKQSISNLNYLDTFVLIFFAVYFARI